MTIAEVLVAATLLAFVIMSSLTALTEAYCLTRMTNAVIQINGLAGLFGAFVGKTVTIAGSSASTVTLICSTPPSQGDQHPKRVPTRPSKRLPAARWSELTGTPGSGAAFARDNFWYVVLTGRTPH